MGDGALGWHIAGRAKSDNSSSSGCPKSSAGRKVLRSEFQEQQGDATSGTIKTASNKFSFISILQTTRRCFHVIVRVNIAGNENAMARDALIWLLCENVVGICDKIAGMNCLKAL